MTNNLLRRGPLILSPNHHYLTYGDGTPFFYLADTWWYACTSRMSWSVFTGLVDRRKRQGFTAIQLVIGYPPEIKTDSIHARNSGGWPLNKNYSVNSEYFDEVEKKVRYIVRSGMVPVIFGGWGYHIDVLGEATIKLLWQEIIRRFNKLPVIWCLCGEVDLMQETLNYGIIKTIISRFTLLIKLAKRIGMKSSKDLPIRLKKWGDIATYIKSNSPHLLTVHIHSRTDSSSLFSNPLWLDINTFQSGHSRDSHSFMVNTTLANRNNNLPVINFEPWYEGIKNDFWDTDQRLAFWSCILSGACGHAYGANGLWQMSTKNHPFLAHWGVSDWREAINYGGAKQIGLAVKWLKKIAWWDLKPTPNRIVKVKMSTLNESPLIAGLPGGYSIMYIPENHSGSIYNFRKIRSMGKCRISYINPITMRRSKTELIPNDTKLSIKIPNNRDWVVTIEHF